MKELIKQTSVSNGLDLGFGFLNNLLSLPFDIAREKRNYDLQYQYNEKAAENAFARQLEFWQMQNEYNTPAAQMRRLVDAGLNPALMNGGVSSNTAGGLSSVSSASVGLSPQHDPIAKLLSVAELSHLFAQSGLIDEQSKNLLEATANLQLENTLKRIFGTEQYLQIKDRAKTMGVTIINEDALDEFFHVNSTEDGKSPLGTDIAFKEQQIAESQARIDDMQATLPYRLEDILSQIDFRNANISQLEESVKLLQAEQKKVGIESDLLQLDYDNKALTSNASAWFGFDISRLPPTLYRFCAGVYKDVMNGYKSPQDALNMVNKEFREYVKKDTHIPETHSYSRKFFSVSESQSHTK